MPTELREIRVDHKGNALPEGVYALVQPDGSVVGYKARWRGPDENGVVRQWAKSFSARRLGSLEAARQAATAHRAGAVAIAERGEAVLRPERGASMTLSRLFDEWLELHAVHNTSERYATDAARWWTREVDPRLGAVRLERLSEDPGVIARFSEELLRAGLPTSSRAKVLSLLRAVLRWGRRRYPRTLKQDFSGLFTLPSQKRRRLIRAADAVTVERLIEATRARRARNELLPLRDAAFVAAMGFTIAARPSEWLRSATWGDVYDGTVELQATDGFGEDVAAPGLKTGARAALLLPNARDRVLAYREALEARFGRPPDDGLVFQVLSEEGPLWYEDGAPVPWSLDGYKRWSARVWRPARAVAAQASEVPDWVAQMTVYDLRHTAISLALHSTLVVTRGGMNLHNLAAYAGHDVTTLQRYYSHIIARYRQRKPIDLDAECQRVRRRVERKPFKPNESPPSPQRDAQRRRRARVRSRRAAAATT